MLLESLRHNLRRLIDFSGRENRAQFLPYAAVMFLLTQAIGMIGILPTFVSMFDRLNTFAAQHPDQSTVTVGPGSYSVTVEGYHPELIPDFTGFFIVLGVAVGTFVVLIAAAVVRRLHDCNRSGLWALAPLALIVTGGALFAILFGQFKTNGEPNLGLFFLSFANNGLYLMLLALLAIQLCLGGKAGDNRFGPAPSPVKT